MNDIQGGRWDELLRRLFPVKEQSIAPAVAPEIVPTIDVQAFEPEMYWAKREFLASGIAFSAGVAGNHSYVLLQMPTQVPALVTLTEIQVYRSGAAGFINLCWDNVGVAGVPVATGYRDSRRSTTTGVAKTIPTLFTGALAAVPADSFFELVADLNRPAVHKEPVVLGPGAGLLLINTALNASVAASLSWRERMAEESERGPQ